MICRDTHAPYVPCIYFIEQPDRPAVLEIVWTDTPENMKEKTAKILKKLKEKLLTKTRTWCIIHENEKEAEHFPFSPAILSDPSGQ